MYKLTTNDGDMWEFDNLEEARKNKYIFGGIIEEIYETNKEGETSGV